MIVGSRTSHTSNDGLNKHHDESSSTASPTTEPTMTRTYSETSSFVTFEQGQPQQVQSDDSLPMTKHSTIPRTISTTETTRRITLLEAAGGSDKNPETGHRGDTIPIVEALVQRGVESEVLQFREEHSEDEGSNNEARAHNDTLRAVLLGMDGHGAAAQGVVVRNNPGTLSPASQAKFDALLLELDERGTKVMSHPEVVRRMGAKDALCKIRHMRCGLEDTNVYYEPKEFCDGFRKSIAFRPRVMKQNRGSQGEGIWICKLKEESTYCSKYGDRVASLDEKLILTEANDNHVEEHTVGEFLEFCINGRNEKSGQWVSTGTGRYLEGGIEAGAMLVDQRFLPRIVEGEVRCLMVGPNLVELIHKKPKEGGLSATLQSGAIYTTYKPDAPEFATLVENFKCDLPTIMTAFGMEDQPLPLLWTADYIFGDKDEKGRDTFYVGEFNCSCVGITKQLQLAHTVAETAVSTCFPEDDGSIDEEESQADSVKVSGWNLLCRPQVIVGAAAVVAVLAMVAGRKRL